MTLLSKTASLEANVARFESDLNKAEFMARRGQRRCDWYRRCRYFGR